MRYRPISILILSIALCGCIYLPVTKTYHNEECGTYRRMTLEAHQVVAFVGCVNEGCAHLLVLAGFVTAASAVVSGSVVVIGKMVYWIEKKAHCLNDPARTRE
jgi:hypothetical protein